MALSLNKSIDALRLNRRLGDATREIETAFTRLNSGMRINKASDDAASIGVASTLDVESRLLSQAVRNINDAIGLLSVTESALHQLSTITMRQKELAHQAANGAYSNKQRQTLTAESEALTTEFNRIIGSTSFNGIKPLDPSSTTLSIQTGITAQGGMQLDIGSAFRRAIGDGTFTASQSLTTAADPFGITTADVNRDGYADIVTADNAANSLSVFLNNGDGTFRARTALSTAAAPRPPEFGDFNGDGILDIVSPAMTGNTIDVFLGLGDGTFGARMSTSYVGGGPATVAVSDINNDTRDDIVITLYNDTPDKLVVAFGVGNGTFQSVQTITTGSNPQGLAFHDINQDGRMDIVATMSSFGEVEVYLQDSTNQFNLGQSINIGSSATSIKVEDLNHDGYADAIVQRSGNDELTVLLGQSDYSFMNSGSIPIGDQPFSTELTDYDEDGYLDIVTAEFSSGTISLLQGNGDGSFGARRVVASSASASSAKLVDVNNDGRLDLIATSFGTDQAFVQFANQVWTSNEEYFNLSSQQNALVSMSILDETSNRISAALSSIGSVRARLDSARNLAESQAIERKSAADRMVSADIAAEAANLIRAKITQSVASSLMASSKLDSQLVLKLLR